MKTSLTQSLPVHRKAIMEQFEATYGRVNATLGVELPFTNTAVQTMISLAYVDPTTETIANGETQIWRITHNGVDVHPVHLHKLNAQVINRIGWDGTIKPPAAGELGWKETIRTNPAEDIVVAIRAKRDSVPFGMPQSMRPMDPHEPLGSTLGFTQVDLTGNPLAAVGAKGYNPNWGKAILAGTVTNAMANYDNEYVWHCHILGHEENDFMRPFVFKPNDLKPDAPGNLKITPTGLLTWYDPTPTAAPAVDAFGVATLGNPKNEIGFKVMRSANNGAFVQAGVALANATSWTDPAFVANAAYTYQVVAYNAAGGSQPSNAVTSSVDLAPTALIFGLQQTALASAAQAVTLTNKGAVPLAITGILFKGKNPAEFTQTNTCGLSVPAASACTINVVFTPKSRGARTAILNVVDAAGTQSVIVSGTGAAPSATVVPASQLKFASQLVGSMSATQPLTITNAGLVPLPMVSPALDLWGNYLDFVLTSNTCGTSLAVGASCTVTVAFKPTAALAGTRTARLTVSTAAGMRKITLTGKAAPQRLVLAPASSLKFATQAVGTTGVAQTVTLTNPDPVPLAITSIGTAVWGNYQDFTLAATTCGQTLAAGASCTVNVAFTPKMVGNKTARLNVVSAAGIKVITLTGKAK